MLTYDARGRLTGEVRTGDHPYNLAYTYDAGGNRKSKSFQDAVSDIDVLYTYDYHNANFYGSKNNRLVEYETYDWSRTPAEQHIATTYHVYNDCGNVERIITKHDPEGGGSTLLGGGGTGESSGDEGSGESLLLVDPCAGKTRFTATRFAYAQNGSAVTFMHDESWCWDGYTWSTTNYNITWGREFRYDSGREKYLVRELDPVQLKDDLIVAQSEVWSDYEGEEIYGDYTVTGGSAANITSYEPGVGRFGWTGAPLYDPDPDSAEYLHSDQLGTLREVSGANGLPGDPRVFTAFRSPSKVNRYMESSEGRSSAGRYNGSA